MKVVDLGRMRYLPAWDVQKRVAEEVIEGGEDTLILVEHEPVLTLGASFHEANLLLPVSEYEFRGIEVVRTDRGGDVTYHGPGQLVVYPVFNLRRHGQDLHRWMRDLEEAVIVALRPLGIEGWRFPPHTGVWVGEGASAKKIAAIGVKVRKWVSLHGIALNVENNLADFDLIVPCGIIGYGVASITGQSGCESVTLDQSKALVEGSFKAVFGKPVA